MKSFGVITNIEKDKNSEFGTRIVEWLRKRGCVAEICGVSARDFEKRIFSETDCFTQSRTSITELCLESDFIVALGGDGTMLRVSRESAFFNKPVLGVNLGHLGYLTDVDCVAAFDALEKVLKGEFDIQKRMMLNITLQKSTDEPISMIGLNDASISRGALSRLINFELRINNEFIDNYRADGVVVSTPTGSTAYNLSAGGPIMKPDAEMIAVTPVCPHMMHSRPHVVSASDRVEVGITTASCNDPVDDIAVAVDGVNAGLIGPGAKIMVSRSEYYASFIKTNSLGFYDLLRKKLVSR